MTLVGLAEATLRSIRDLRRRRETEALASILAGKSGYSFTSDYISTHTDNWSRFLQAYQEKPGVRMLEIGSFEGRSAVWFLEHILTHPSSELVCVDLFSVPSFAIRFDHNIDKSGAAARVTKVKGNSADLLLTFPHESFDIIYVDGSHTAAAVLLDARLAWFLLKPGGVLMFDDYFWEFHLPQSQRPQLAIDLFLGLFEGHYEVLLKEYQVIIRRRDP